MISSFCHACHNLNIRVRRETDNDRLIYNDLCIFRALLDVQSLRRLEILLIYDSCPLFSVNFNRISFFAIFRVIMQ